MVALGGMGASTYDGLLLAQRHRQFVLPPESGGGVVVAIGAVERTHAEWCAHAKPLGAVGGVVGTRAVCDSVGVAWKSSQAGVRGAVWPVDDFPHAARAGKSVVGGESRSSRRA